MVEHRLFYFPYATMFDAQLPLLKTAALYFDKLLLLDPRDASWDRVGADQGALDEVLLLDQHGLLERVSPAKVLERAGAAFADAVRADLQDSEFIGLCSEQARRAGRHTWSLALAKVPDDLLVDQQLRELLGGLAPRLASEMAHRIDDYVEHRQAMSFLPGNEGSVAPREVVSQGEDYRSFSRDRLVYDEVREDYAGNDIDYRYIEVPLALGESIMVNHALFGGLVLSEATPISDDTFHAEVLAQKLRRAINTPDIRHVLEQRVRERGLRADLFTTAALRDPDLKLPVLSPDLPVSAVLEYRDEHADELASVREHLSRMARRIEAEPWTADFAHELDRRTIPDLAAELDAVRRARDDWVDRKRKRGMLSGASLAAGAGAAVLTVLAAPITPIALAVAGLSLVGSSVLPGAEWLGNWKEGKSIGHENGLVYLLRPPG